MRLYARSARLGPLTDPALQAKTLEIFSRDLPLLMSAGEVQLALIGDNAAPTATAAAGDEAVE